MRNESEWLTKNSCCSPVGDLAMDAGTGTRTSETLDD